MGGKTHFSDRKNFIRLIAREGLIIITLIVITGIFYLLYLWFNIEKTTFENYKMKAQAIEMFKAKEKTDKSPGLKSFHIVWMFPKNTKDEVIAKVLKRDFTLGTKNEIIDLIYWDNSNNLTINAYYDRNGKQIYKNPEFYKIKLPYLYIFIPIFLYPLYWVGRFIFWSIGILREKE